MWVYAVVRTVWKSDFAVGGLDRSGSARLLVVPQEERRIVPTAVKAIRMTNRRYFKGGCGVINRLFTSSATEISVANQWPPALHSAWFAEDCAMLAEFEKQLSQTLEEIKSQGLYKTERVITTPQDAHISVAGGKRVLNMCANNYLGLADHPELIKAAKEALD